MRRPLGLFSPCSVGLATLVALLAFGLNAKAPVPAGGSEGNLPRLLPPTASSDSTPTRRVAASVPLAARATVSRALGRDLRAYQARSVGTSVLVANPAQGLNVRFGRDGLVVRAGTTGLRLRLRGYGRGRLLAPVARIAPRARGNRVVYPRVDMSEWYINGPF